jgi:fructuronate reductase
LCLERLDAVPEALRPVPSPASLSLGIVHLGIGAFHRAHQAVYTQLAMAHEGSTRWGICGVTQRSPAVADDLVPQDGLYTVLERSGPTTRGHVVGSVREVLVAQDQPEAVTGRLASPATAVVTLTVTEKGYRFDPSTGHLRGDDPEVRADADGRPPRTVVGQLAAGLQERRRQGGPSVTVLCCDNLPSNGRTLRRLVDEFWDLAGGRQAEELKTWAAAHVSFPCTVVDRIVPATSADDRAAAAGLLGMEDHGVVVTEPFSQWVIEDRFAGPRPAWGDVGAMLVPDVAPYEEMKLRLLNGSHSALAYLGALAGCQLVSGALAEPGFADFVRAFMDHDVTPTLTVPAGFDLAGYKVALMERFANPALRHRTAQVAMDGTQKLPYRLLAPIAARLAAGAEPRYACLAVAGWMRYVIAGASDTGAPLPLEDPLAARLRAAVAAPAMMTPASAVSALLSLPEVFPPDLAGDPTFRRLVTSAYADLVSHGAAAVVAGTGREGPARPA